jgi:RNA polymerase sigma factor (sigma-70 family)
MKRHTPNLVDSLEEWMARQRYSKGDSEALGKLWTWHYRWLHFQALRCTRQDHDLADDALGELGVKLSRREIMRMYRPTESWKHWARSILQNIVRDMFRRKHRPQFLLTRTKAKKLVDDGVSRSTVEKLFSLVGRSFWDEGTFRRAVAGVLSPAEFRNAWSTILERARAGQHHLMPYSENEAHDGAEKLLPAEQAAWNEFLSRFNQVLEELPWELRAVFIMHIGLGWPFIRIAEVLHGKQDANLVSRPYYRARNLVKAQLCQLGHGHSQPACCCNQTIA